MPLPPSSPLALISPTRMIFCSAQSKDALIQGKERQIKELEEKLEAVQYKVLEAEDRVMTQDSAHRKQMDQMLRWSMGRRRHQRMCRVG